MNTSRGNTNQIKQVQAVKMNVLLFPGKEPTLISQKYSGKKGRANCRAAARHFAQATGMETLVCKLGGDSSPARFCYMAGKEIPMRGKVVSRYGHIPNEAAG